MEQWKVKYYKSIIFLFIAVLSIQNSYAWERRSDSTLFLSAGGGIAFTNFKNHIYGSDFHPGFGEIFGIQAYLKPWQEFGFSTSILYLSRQFTIDNRIPYYNENMEIIGNAPSKYDINQLSIPLKARYNFGNKFNVYAEVGISFQLLISAKRHAVFDTITNFTGNPDDYIYDIREDHHSLSLSILAGGGIEYYFSSKLSVFLEYNWQQDMSKLFDYEHLAGNSNPKMLSQTIQIGVRYGLPIKYSVSRRYQ
jgi:hypothetical protein